jgi:hypothetical protein
MFKTRNIKRRYFNFNMVKFNIKILKKLVVKMIKVNHLLSTIFLLNRMEIS